MPSGSGAAVTTFSSNVYGSPDYDTLLYTALVRPVLYEDRFMGVSQRFFCNKATEKTVTLRVEDALGNVHHERTKQVGYPTGQSVVSVRIRNMHVWVFPLR